MDFFKKKLSIEKISEKIDNLKKEIDKIFKKIDRKLNVENDSEKIKIKHFINKGMIYKKKMVFCILI